jgi:hypothetical protein
MNRPLLVLATVALVLAACGGEAPIETDGTLPPMNGGSGDVPEAMLAELLDSAAAETGVSRDEISVVIAEAVTWSDGSIGCPEPGMGYTQALVDGYRVILDVAGEEIAYHASLAGDFRACADPEEPIDG